MADDPFTQTLAKLWELLESHEGFAGLVRLRNRVKLVGDGAQPAKAQALPADLPQVLIEPAGGQADLPATSGSTRAVQDFAVLIGTGQARAETLFALKWQMMKALSRAGEGLGLPFVRKVRIGELSESSQDKANGPANWSARWVISVEMWFANSLLRGD